MDWDRFFDNWSDNAHPVAGRAGDSRIFFEAVGSENVVVPIISGIPWRAVGGISGRKKTGKNMPFGALSASRILRKGSEYSRVTAHCPAPALCITGRVWASCGVPSVACSRLWACAREVSCNGWLLLTRADDGMMSVFCYGLSGRASLTPPPGICRPLRMRTGG